MVRGNPIMLQFFIVLLNWLEYMPYVPSVVSGLVIDVRRNLVALGEALVNFGAGSSKWPETRVLLIKGDEDIRLGLKEYQRKDLSLDKAYNKKGDA